MISLGLTNAALREPAELSPLAAQALAETAAWCALDSSLLHQFRSPEIDPSSALQPPLFPDTQESIEAWVQARFSQYQQAVSQLIERRSDLLRSQGVVTADCGDVARADGRLLLYDPIETVTCGASSASSSGFFDGEDAPPWDTWFWYSNGTILSWVPEHSVTRAQAGIDANPVDCIRWADWRKLARLTL